MGVISPSLKLKQLMIFLIIFLFISFSLIPAIAFSNLLVISEQNISDIDSSAFIKIDESGLMNSSWPMKCHDQRHTGRSAYSTENVTGVEKWRFKTDGEVRDSPAVGLDGTIYIGSYSRQIYAINPDGTERWSYMTDDIIRGSSPAIAEDGTIFIGSWDGELYAMNPDGSLKWKFSQGGSIASSPVIAVDGTIYFGTLGNTIGRIFSINQNGTENWRYDTDYKTASDPCIGQDGTIYMGSGDDYLYAMNPNGSLKWRYKTGNDIQSPPSIGEDGTVYVASQDGYLYSLFPENGTLKWKYKAGNVVDINPSIDVNGIIYSGEGSLHAIYPDGTMKWSYSLGNGRYLAFSSPALSVDGTIYVGTTINGLNGGEIVAINSDGTEKWRKLIAETRVHSSPSIGADGTIYIGSESLIEFEPGKWKPIGYLHAFGSVESNEPPTLPTIQGPPEGKAGESYYYEFSASDPDNNPIHVYIEWGDGTSFTTRECTSGENLPVQHSWSERDTYTIRAKTIDSIGAESDWATLEVEMPHVNFNLLTYLRQLMRFRLRSSTILENTEHISSPSTTLIDRNSYIDYTRTSEYPHSRNTNILT